MTAPDQPAETPMRDHVAKVLDLMAAGGAIRIMDITDDASHASYTFSGDVSLAVVDFIRNTRAAPVATPAPDDLVARLRWHGEHPVTGELVLTNPDGPAAADRIEALTAEVARRDADRVALHEKLKEVKIARQKAEAERDAAVKFLTEAAHDLSLEGNPHTNERGKECLATLARIKEGKL